MKGQFLKMAVATLLVLGVSIAYAGARKASDANEPSKSKSKSYTGTVDVTRDKAGNITAVKLKVGKIFKHTYNVTLDEKGKELGEKMAGKRVHVKGTLEKKAGVKWLTVKEYSEVTTKPAKKSAK